MLGVKDELLLLIRDFLVGRTMRIRAAGKTNDPKAVTSGVTQVSVLG